MKRLNSRQLVLLERSTVPGPKAAQLGRLSCLRARLFAGAHAGQTGRRSSNRTDKMATHPALCLGWGTPRLINFGDGSIHPKWEKYMLNDWKLTHDSESVGDENCHFYQFLRRVISR